MSSVHAHRIHLKRLLPAILAGLVSSFAFVAFFTSALHDPRPNGLQVAVVGPPPAAQEVQQSLDQALPGGFAVRRYDDEAAARRALREQDADGVFVPGAEPRRLLAGGAGANATTALRTAFGAAAGAQGQHLAVTDAAPLPQHDSRGLSAFFLVAGTSVGSLVFAAALFFLGGHAAPVPLRLRLTLIGAFAMVAGLVVAIDTGWVVDGLGGAFWGVAGVGALLAATVALVTTAVVRWLGTPGIGLCVLAMMLFSLPASGGAVGPEFVPDFYRAVAPILPSHAALLALRGTVYFDGGGTTGPILILLAWIASAVVAILAAHVLRRDPPRIPVLGGPIPGLAD
ncbi:MAG: hypothetical protein JWR63_2999 [Conexibacter sp.]|nr:hypothetical protein [Conexibacter sp.]